MCGQYRARPATVPAQQAVPVPAVPAVVTKTAKVDGKEVAYTPTTVFVIQTGASLRGRYEFHDSVTGDLPKALKTFRKTHIKGAVKKRLVMNEKEVLISTIA